MWFSTSLPFLSALVAVGLLPVKKLWPSRCVCLALALLWGWLAWSAWRLGPVLFPGWGVLAGLEALLFLGLAGLRRPAFQARNGLWAVTGTVFLLFSLVMFPVLGRLLAGAEFEMSVFGCPFPPVLFTCGALLLASEQALGLAFVPLLLWAFAGGPGPAGAAAGPAEIWGLRLALLAGALFLVQPAELRGADDGRSAQAILYRKASRDRSRFARGLWALILSTTFVVLMTDLGEKLAPPMPLNLVLLSALGVALWLFFSAWQSLWYRYAAWGAARTIGRLWAWTKDAWRWIVLLLGAAALWIRLIPEPAARHPRLAQGPLAIFLAALLLWLSYRAYRGRQRLVIGQFANYTGDDKMDKWVTGLGARLQTELARIADVYQVIDEARPSAEGQVVEVTPGVQEVGEILQEASAIDFAVKIPTKLLVGIVGRLVSGPRLTGALHKVDDQYVLTAELNGGGRSFDWRVDFRKLDPQDHHLSGQAAVHKLVQQLAFRVTTDLVAVGSPRWRAVRCFTAGLRSYREALRQREKSSKLRAAERSFIQALSDDQRFTQCHYNLGVTFLRLGELGSAESAFRRALKEDPDNFEACYGLAETLVNGEKYLDALWFCKMAIGINAADARPWDLAALALRKAEEQRRNKRLPRGDRFWKDIREWREIAVALAWRNLCRRALRGPSPLLEKARATAFLCTRNLAVVLSRATVHDDVSPQVFRQAAWLAPHDPDLRLFEGRSHVWSKSWQNAAKALEGTFEEGLPDFEDRGLLWHLMAQVRTHVAPEEARRDTVRLAHQRFLDLAATATVQELRALLKVSLEAPPATEKRP